MLDKHLFLTPDSEITDPFCYTIGTENIYTNGKILLVKPCLVEHFTNARHRDQHAIVAELLAEFNKQPFYNLADDFDWDNQPEEQGEIADCDRGEKSRVGLFSTHRNATWKIDYQDYDGYPTYTFEMEKFKMKILMKDLQILKADPTIEVSFNPEKRIMYFRNAYGEYGLVMSCN